MDLCSLRSHALEHIQEDVLRFGNLSILGASPHRHFNFIMKSFITMIPTKGGRTIKEAAIGMNEYCAKSDREGLKESKKHRHS